MLTFGEEITTTRGLFFDSRCMWTIRHCCQLLSG